MQMKTTDFDPIAVSRRMHILLLAGRLRNVIRRHRLGGLCQRGWVYMPPFGRDDGMHTLTRGGWSFTGCSVDQVMKLAEMREAAELQTE
jgi:hypothetical protein